jgi:hypothetical protein
MPPDILASLPTELQNAVLHSLRELGGIQSLFSHRRVSSRWCRLIDTHLYHYFVCGPDVLYCYVNLWNRFRQKLIQQRVALRLRIRTIQYTPKFHDSSPSELRPQGAHTHKEPVSRSSPEPSDGGEIISWQPSSQSSRNPSLSLRKYVAYIYDACFDAKYNEERSQIRPIDIDPRTSRPISLGSGLTKLLARANQPPRSGTIFPLFHIIQEAWDFILGEDAALMPIYPPIASEAWLQIRLATGTVPARYREPPALYIEQSRDPFWPFTLDEYATGIPGPRDASMGQHQFAVVSRLALPNLVEDEGILLVTVRDTVVAEWIQDERYREVMQTMINFADVGGPQEFVLGGAVVQLEDFQRFIPSGMVDWFKRRILDKHTNTVSPASLNEATAESRNEEQEHQAGGLESVPERGTEDYNSLPRLQRSMEAPEGSENAGCMIIQ